MDGWIKLHRKLTEWEWYSDINVKTLFIHLLLTANHKDQKWKGIEIKRGQKLTSIEHLSKEIGLTYQQTRTAINKLKSTGEITSKTTNKYSLISVEKYNDYQICTEKNNEQITNNLTTNQQSNNKQTNNQITTNKNDKNIKNEKKEKNVYNIVKCYEENIGMLNPASAEIIFSYLDDFSEEIIIEAIKRASINNKKSCSYIKGILNNWLNKGYKTLADIDNEKSPVQLKELEKEKILDLYEN